MCACAWGLFWLPLRYLQAAGFEGAWASVCYFGLGAAVLIPMAIIRRQRLRQGGKDLVLIGLFSGTALALYTLSFLFTTVTKALLIFYLTPVWSTLLACWVLGEKLSPSRFVALALGIGGLWVILSDSGSLPLPENIGDWMALVGGIAWAFAAVRLNTSSEKPAEYLVIFMACALLVSSIILILSGGLDSPPRFSALSVTAIVVLSVIAVLTLPINAMILWATTRLSPGRVGLLMLFEIIVGIAVAAVLTDEPYGQKEFLGTVMILAAAAVDILIPHHWSATET